jgi:hypothetical protein
VLDEDSINDASSDAPSLSPHCKCSLEHYKLLYTDLVDVLVLKYKQYTNWRTFDATLISREVRVLTADLAFTIT